MAISYDWEWETWDWRIFIAIIALYLIYFARLMWLCITEPMSRAENDEWNKCIIKTWWFEDNCISFWPITHFLLYLGLGLVLPVKYYKYFVVAGILWEILEYTGGKCLPAEKRDYHRNTTEEYQYDDWVTGKFGDLVANMAGLFLGFGLKTIAVKTYNSVAETPAVKTAPSLSEIEST